MTRPEPAPVPPPEDRPLAFRPDILVAATTAVQTLISLGVLSLPALAPFVAAALGLPAHWVGGQIGLLYCFAIASSLLAPQLVRRWGSGRASQCGLVLLAVGLAVATIPTFAATVFALALIGFCYGLPNPAASHLLARHIPPRHRNFMFSIKQSGVPLGGVLAGLVVVPIADRFGWRPALLLPAGLALGLAVALQAVRPTWDFDRDPQRPLWRSPAATLRLVLGEAPLRLLFVSGILLAAAQLCLSTFLVVLLVEDYRFGPVAAGTVMAVVQGVGFCSRMLWGVAADRLGGGARALTLLATLLALSAGVLGGAPPGSLGVALLPVLMVLGACASGWSGVFLAEADHRAPRGHASEAAAVSLIGTFFGVIAGTSIFAAVVPLIGSYSRAFLMVAAGAAVAAALMARSGRLRP